MGHKEQHTMNTNTPHAQALADKAESLYTKHKHAEAFATYRAAVSAGYKTHAEQWQERKDRESIQAAALGFLLFTLAIAAVAAKVGFFF
jgi:hypothetical protein